MSKQPHLRPNERAAMIDANQPFLLYTNFVQGVQMGYPATWGMKEQTYPKGFLVYFASPPDEPGDKFAENVNIYMEPVPSTMTSDAYAQACLEGMKQLPYQYQENTAVQVAGRPGRKLVYVGPLQDIPMGGKFTQHYVAIDGKGFVVTFTAELVKFDSYLPLVNRMVESLQLR